MVRGLTVAALAAVCLGHSAVALALSASLVDRAERATALVDVTTSSGRSFGSAFCIGDTGLFATDGHVVAGSSGEIKIVIRPGEKDQHVAVGHLLGIDYDADLAVIQTDNPGPMQKLALGNSDGVLATQEVTAFGYPFGNMLALDKDSYPSITVNTGKVTALRKQKGDLALIQMDALVNPGNSGGPVLDDDGKVIGLVESGVPGAGLNFATPVARLKKMLDGPMVVLNPVVIDCAQRTKQQTFSIHVTSLAKKPVEYTVDFKITDAKGAVRTVLGKTSAGRCDLQIVPTTDSTEIKWNPFEGDPPTYKFTLALKQLDKVVGTQEGRIFLSNVPLDGEIVKTSNPRNGNAGGAGRGNDWPKQNPLNPLPANAQDTPLVGAEEKDEFREVTNKFAIGVQYIRGSTDGKTVFGNIRLLYGKPGGEKGESIMGREGYVVGGLVAGTGEHPTGLFVSGFKVIFIRLKGQKLDPSDTYASDWTGDTATPEDQKQLAGKGERVIGIRGRKGMYVRGVGLVIQKSDAPPATPPAGK